MRGPKEVVCVCVGGGGGGVVKGTRVLSYNSKDSKNLKHGHSFELSFAIRKQ